MSAIETTVTETEEQAAERVAAEFSALLNEGASAHAYQLDGEWCVVTSGTGEGYDFAYAACDIDGTFDRYVDDNDGFDYSAWCASIEVAAPLVDINYAVAYYMIEERVLGEGGSCNPLLTAEQIEVLKITKRIA